MKTLDEVIKAMDVCSNGKGCENCCYRIVDEDGFEMYTDCPAKDADALHYLKEYRNCGACAYADSYLRCTREDRNDPLTWEQLKQMEGKPVWVEWDNQPFRSAWFVVGRFHSLFASDDYDAYVWLYNAKQVEAGKENHGSYWQAYRKER